MGLIHRRKRLIKWAEFPTYKTFEGYSYHCVKFPTAFNREELETLELLRRTFWDPCGQGVEIMQE